MYMNNYIDVTEKWIKEAKPKSGIIRFLNYAIASDNKKYDFTNSVLSFDIDNDFDIGTWFKNTLWGNVRYQPAIKYPHRIKTADLRVFRCPYIMGKTIEIKTINSKRRDGIGRRLKEAQKQSENILLDVTNYPFDIEIIKYEIHKFFVNHKTIKTIIVKRDNSLLFVWQK